MRNFLYCGPLGLGGPKRRRGDSGLHPLAAFEGRKIVLTHMARTGIHIISSLISTEGSGEILVPAYNCGSEIDSIIAGGSIPVMYRVDHKGRIDCEDIAGRITAQTRAIYVIHYFGFPQDLTEVRELCLKRGLFLIEDCALSLFSSMSRTGVMGDAVVFSLPKSLPTPDGGVLIINNSKLDSIPEFGPAPIKPVIKRFIRIARATILHKWNFLWPVGNALRSKGSIIDNSNDHGLAPITHPDIPQDYYFSSQQVNRSMSALSQRVLNRIDTSDVIARRRFNYQYLVNGLKGIEGIQLPLPYLDEDVVPLVLPVCTERRRLLVAFLQGRGIAAIPWWAGYHRSLSWEQFPESRNLKNTITALPIHQCLEQKHLDHILSNLTEFV